MPIIPFTCRHAAAEPIRSYAATRWMRWSHGSIGLMAPLRTAGRALRDQARALARALGGGRDAQSALDALSDLAGHGDLSQRSLATLRGRIEALRQSAETNTLNVEMRVRLNRALDKATASVELWPLHSLTFSDLAERLAHGYRAARNALPEPFSDANG